MRVLLVSFVIVLVGFIPPADAEQRSVRYFEAEGLRFEVGPQHLAIHVNEEDAVELLPAVVVDRSGLLMLRGREVDIDRGDRALLKKLYSETSKLSALIEAMSEDIAAQVRPELDSRERERLARRLERTVERAKKQNTRVADVAQRLLERIPELEVLRRFAEE